jgi:DNA-binding Lrp family transcriptional regulator
LRLDELDRRIVAALSTDGRRSYRDIGDEVGLSAPAVKRRVDRLRAEGVIERFTAVLDPRALGWSPEVSIGSCPSAALVRSLPCRDRRP